MAHGEDAAMNAVQVLRLDAGGAPLLMDPGPLELSERDDAVLAGGNSRHEGVWIGLGDFRMHGYP
jgi:hypothetical protein